MRPPTSFMRLLGAATLFIAGAAWSAVPQKLQHQGRLLAADDEPLTANVDITVTLHKVEVDRENEENRVWEHTFTGVHVDGGLSTAWSSTSRRGPGSIARISRPRAPYGSASRSAPIRR